MKINLKQQQYAFMLLCSFLIAGCSGGGSSAENNNSTTDNVTMAVEASSLFTVPNVVTSATASGDITLDKNSGNLSGSITATNLTGPVTAAHIHKGLAGIAGGIIVTLEQDAGNATQFNVPSGTTLSQTEMDELLTSQYYINIHTAANAPGEARGQIVAADYAVIRTELTGENQIPVPVSTVNSGIAYVTVNTVTGVINSNIRNTGMDDASAAHIHTGFAGANGGVELGFTQDAGDTALWTIPETTLSNEQLANLLAGGHYYNGHTPANAAGEVRGQIIPNDIELVRVSLIGENQVPTPVNSAGSAIGYLTVNKNNGSLVAKVITSGLSDTTAGHIHTGFAGTNGGVLLALTKDADVFSSADGDTFDSTALADFSAGNMYFNIHTATNAAGEVRGSIAPANISIVRSELDGSQEVPAVVTAASGIGYTTVNTEDGTTVANVRTSGMTATAGHIHIGAVGTNGGIALALSQDATDTDFWSVSGVLDDGQLDNFSADELYFNMHSTLHASGEIRTQITP